MSAKLRNVIVTLNNPKVSLEEWLLPLRKEFAFGRAQLERGESGTLHFQGCFGLGERPT